MTINQKRSEDVSVNSYPNITNATPTMYAEDYAGSHPDAVVYYLYAWKKDVEELVKYLDSALKFQVDYAGLKPRANDYNKSLVETAKASVQVREGVQLKNAEDYSKAAFRFEIHDAHRILLGIRNANYTYQYDTHYSHLYDLGTKLEKIFDGSRGNTAKVTVTT